MRGEEASPFPQSPAAFSRGGGESSGGDRHQPHHRLSISSFRLTPNVASTTARRRRRSSGATSISAATTSRDILSQLRNARDRNSALEQARRASKINADGGRQAAIPDRITTFTLFTPIALEHTPEVPDGGPGVGDEDDAQPNGVRQQSRRRRRRPGAPIRGFSRQRVDPMAMDPSQAPKHSSKVLNTTSFDAVRQRLYALRKTRQQEDNAEADLGKARQGGEGTAEVVKDEEPRGPVQAHAHTQRRSEQQVTFLDDDDEDGDLSLPPPALDLPVSALSSTPSRPVQTRIDGQDRYMSDVPLTPRVQMAKAMEFSRGFEAQMAAAAATQTERYSPILEEANEEQANSGGRDAQHLNGGQHSHWHQEAEQGQSGSSNPQTAVPSPASVPNLVDESNNAAWWLDVSCPTYETMTALSQMFPLHPLTVEDVLMQEPREKVEIFDRLGYYFLVLRAIDERYFRYTSASGTSDSVESKKGDADKGEIEMENITSEKRSSKPKSNRTSRKRSSSTGSGGRGHRANSSSSRSSDGSSDSESSSSSGSSSSDDDDETGEKWRRKMPQRARVDIVEGLDGKEGVEGVSVGAINLYLIVFSHGIISFHFEDVAKHTDAVLRRLTDVTQHRTLTSDWIAHGVYDSIIDAFFPLQAYIDTELKDFELLMDDPLFSADDRGRKAKRKHVTGVEGRPTLEGLPMTMTNETIRVTVLRILPRLEVGRTLKRLLPSFMLDRRLKVYRYRTHDSDASLDDARRNQRGLFRRMVRRKRYQTAFLSESAQKQNALLRRITEARKISTGLTRLLQPKNDSIRGLRKHLTELRAQGPAQEEMSIYIGDVHDHIVTLLGLMTSDENRLGDIHSSYLASIRLANNRAHHKTDTALIALISIGFTVMATLFLISLFSINALTPRNDFLSNDYHWFIGIVIGSCLIPCLIATRVWLWMRQAKSRAEARRAAR